jgi:hypothetical protein
MDVLKIEGHPEAQIKESWTFDIYSSKIFYIRRGPSAT